MGPTEQLTHILPTVSAMVDRIQVMQMDDPTPCPEFTVHDVIDHKIVLGGTFAYWFRGEEAPDLKGTGRLRLGPGSRVPKGHARPSRRRPVARRDGTHDLGVTSGHWRPRARVERAPDLRGRSIATSSGSPIGPGTRSTVCATPSRWRI